MNQRKKCLIISYNGLGISGVPYVIINTIKATCHTYDTDILVFNDDNRYESFLKKYNVKVIKYKIRTISLLGKTFNHYNGLYSYCNKLFKNTKYDVIHSFKEADSWPIFKAARRSKIKKRIFHCNVIHDYHHFSFKNLMSSYFLHLSTKYATTLLSVTTLAGTKAFKKKDFLTVYNPCQYICYARHTNNQDENIYIIHVASIASNKNQLFSLKIIKELLKISTKYRLLLIGRNIDEDYNKKILKFVKENNLSSYISIIGEIDKVDTFYNLCQLAILPSIKEGASLVAVEAQSFGKYVLLSTSISKEVNCGGCIYLNINEGAEAWANKIHALYINGQLIKPNSFDVSKFSFDTFRKKIISIYDN